MPFPLDMKQLLPPIHRLAIILFRDSERLMFQREEGLVVRSEEYFLLVDAEDFGADLEDLFFSFRQSLFSSTFG
jgi:hypothetical protein